VTDQAIADAAGNSERMIAEVYRHQTTPTIGTHVAAIDAQFGPVGNP
jgi:hypothetical protein